ncbi:MAG: helix-turn-helix transcriptional regulator [Armatimonadota bacterium]
MRRVYRLTTDVPVRVEYDSYRTVMSWDADVHQEFEFGVVLAGEQERRSGLFTEGVHASGAGTDALKPGDVWLSAMWEPHWWRVTQPGTTEVFVQFRPEFLGNERVGDHSWFEMFAASPRERPKARSPALRDTVLSLAGLLADEARRLPRNWDQAVRLDLLRILLELGRNWQPGRPGRGAVRSTDLHRIIPALAEVNERVPRRVSLGDAAALCGMSRALFCSIFRDSTGVTFAQFVLRARLAWVSSHLLSDEDTVASIAARAGFADESHLHRTFVKHYGCTPAQFRLDNLSARS